MFGVKSRFICLLIACYVVLNSFSQESTWPQRVQLELDSLIQKELGEGMKSTQLGLYVYDLTTGNLIFDYGATQLLRPASTQKLITSIAALHYLGKDYELQTQILKTGEIKDGILYGDIYVKGGFDPAFGYPDMESLVQFLKWQQIDSLAGRICADLSFKDTLQWGSGWCWDDEMPILTPLLLEGKDEFMQAFISELQRQEIGCELEYWKEPAPDNALMIARVGRPIQEILNPSMKDSDNLYAEALFYQIAARSGKPYASGKDAARQIQDLIREMGYVPEQYKIADGSGVSLYNYLTPEIEVAFLQFAHQRKDIYSELFHSLPIGGVDGTLKNRMRKGNSLRNIRAKTGTVECVSTLEGYATAANGNLLAFCIMNQGVVRGAVGREFQNKVCEILCTAE